MSNDRLGMIVVKRYGTGDERGELAQVSSVCDAPSFNLKAPSGSEYHWRQDLTRPASEMEIIEYWKQRTEIAESLCNKLTEVNAKLLDHVSELANRLVKASEKGDVKG